jgi:hypothetical protein
VPWSTKEWLICGVIHGERDAASDKEYYVKRQTKNFEIRKKYRPDFLI